MRFSAIRCFPVSVYRHNALFLLNYPVYGQFLSRPRMRRRIVVPGACAGDLCTELSTDSVHNRGRKMAFAAPFLAAVAAAFPVPPPGGQIHGD